jgi:putative component of toxin-antitoxin plasmid stabilization module
MAQREDQCRETSIPRACADEFREGASRMTRIETTQNQVAGDVKEMKETVKEIRSLIDQGRGVKAAFAAVCSVIGGAIVVAYDWLKGR